jgi:hypothetical protein
MRIALVGATAGAYKGSLQLLKRNFAVASDIACFLYIQWMDIEPRPRKRGQLILRSIYNLSGTRLFHCVRHTLALDAF